MTPEEQLQALLRIKRYEQPPPGYFDQLLADVHRRQRAELLRRPLWRIALERLQTFFGEHSMGPLQYGGAMAVVVALGLGAISVMTPSGSQNSTHHGTMAQAGPMIPDRNSSNASSVSVADVDTTPVPISPQRRLVPVAGHRRYMLDQHPLNLQNDLPLDSYY